MGKVLECSTRGDKRFSAFCAYITTNGKTDSIEHFYQNSKRTADGSVVKAWEWYQTLKLLFNMKG